MARPRKKVDEKLLEHLAFIHLPDSFIAKCLGISEDTLHRRYAEKISEHKAKGKAKLISKAWGLVEKDEWPAIKFLLTNWLGMSDKIEQTIGSQDSQFKFNYETGPMNGQSKKPK
jgi:hypothetical protein